MTGRTRSDLTPRPARGKLPSFLDSVIGRQPEVDALHQLVVDKRLVTLTGIGGVGKTRLAIEVARVAAPDFPDGVWLVELAPVVDPVLVPQAVASALALHEQAGTPLLGTLVGHLRRRRALIVLDNAEHVITACAELADGLLSSCPDLTILATSQEPLTIAGEYQWPVPRIPVPDAGETDVDALARSPAVQLFCARAEVGGAALPLDAETAAAVAEICRRLDGIPLAIELAAARVTTLSPAEIAARLDDRFRLLTGGSRTVLPRHQTLRGAVDWSFDLLSNPERALLRRLSVFVGGITCEAVEQVCTGDGVDRSETFDLLARLVGRSLVAADTSGPETRYCISETLRHYCRDRLVDAGEAAERRGGHAEWCVALAQEAEGWLTGPRQEAWFDRLEAEHDNLRAALAWLTTRGEAQAALRLSASLTLFWRVRGYYTEGRRWLEGALALGDAPPAHRASALWGAGFLALMVDDPVASSRWLEASMALFQELGDATGQARALLLLGNGVVFDEPARALDLLGRSVDLARQAGDTWCLSHALAECGLAHLARGEMSDARRVLEESVAAARHAQDDQGLRIGLTLLGDLALRLGDFALAERLLDEALALVLVLDESYGIAAALGGQGELATARGAYDRADDLLGRALGVARSTANPPLVARVLTDLGELALARGEPDMARERFEEARAETGSDAGVLVGLARSALALGDPATARALLQKAGAVVGSHQSWGLARLRQAEAELEQATGNPERALVAAHGALHLRSELGDAAGVVESLETVVTLDAELAGSRGRLERAARLLGATDEARRVNGYGRTAAASVRRAVALRRLHCALGADEGLLESLRSEGAELSLEAAVSHATKGRGRRDRPATGWDSLTRTEREVVGLVGGALTNAEIARRLAISPGTVKGHLSHVFAKLGVSSRLELLREVLDKPPG